MQRMIQRNVQFSITEPCWKWHHQHGLRPDTVLLLNRINKPTPDLLNISALSHACVMCAFWSLVYALPPDRCSRIQRQRFWALCWFLPRRLFHSLLIPIKTDTSRDRRFAFRLTAQTGGSPCSNWYERLESNQRAFRRIE
jgi:hypothetical protein